MNTVTRTTSVAVLVTLGLALTARAAEPPSTSAIGYRGDGSGVFPASNPPVDCDMKTGRNILWTAPLPNWGHGSPIVVKDRAFVLSEPGWKHDWPVLTCFDIATGKVLWEREVNHLPATGLEAAKQAEIAGKWREFHATWRKLYTTFAETVGQKKPEEAVARFEQMGWDKWPFAYGFPFTIAGDRIYVRSFDQLICIGKKP